MFPFVLLYGFSGWFFNHPGYFRDGVATSFKADQVAGGKLAGLPTAAEIAESVVGEMNGDSKANDGPEVSLTSDKTPRFTSFYSYSVRTEEANHVITINPTDGSGEVKTTPVEGSDEQPKEELENPIDDFRSAELKSNPVELVRDSVPGLLADLGLPSGEASRGRRSPSVIFSVEAEGVPCLVMYSLSSGAIASVRQDSRSELDFQDVLKRMHLSRTYSPQFDTRWIWAVVVDIMFVSMVFWGISGLFMWWQVKRTRVLGGIVLVASVIFSALMYAGMQDNLTERPPRRSSSGQSMILPSDAAGISAIAMQTGIDR